MRPSIVGAIARMMTGAIALTSAGALVHAQEPTPEPTLDLVLARAGEYVVEYQRQLSGIVAEETYLQIFERRPGIVAQRRELKSDVLMVRPPGLSRYVQFRDVFEVDGRPVRDRQERLTRLFLDPSLSATSQMNRIMDESARYNIGNIERTMNVPTLAMVFLDPMYQPRFRFTRTTERVPETLNGPSRGLDGSVARFRASTEVWVIEYQETERNTLIRTSGGIDLPASGRFWIEPATGELTMTELTVGDSGVRGLVDVSYALEPSAGVVVPVAMRERYQNPRTGAMIEGSATYSRFRKFGVTARENVPEPPR